MKSKQKRPKFLNLFAIHLPVTGITSIAHRVSGALMFLAIPAMVYLFGLSLHSQADFDISLKILHSWSGKIGLSLLAWALAHHVLAGLRFLLLDVNVGERLSVAKGTAWTVNVAGIVVFLYLLLKIWL